MKTLVQRVNASPKYAKAFEWGKLITITGGAQVVIQGFGFLSGILVIRLLSTQEYALYTLSNTMLGSMVMLADSGISNGVMAEGGKVWKDKRKLGVVLATGLSLRMKFGVLAILITFPILSYLLLEHGANWISIFLIFLAIIPAFYASLSDSFLEMAPKLHQDITPLQKNQAEVSFGRLILNSVLLFLFPFTFVGLVAISIPRIYGNYKLRKISAQFASDEEKPDPLVQKEITRSVKRTMPIVLYHCISGQISIWLISFFGTTANIAQIGALGRLSMIFTLISIVFSTLVVPRFARLKDSSTGILKPFVYIQALMLIVGIAITISIVILSDQILWIFGEQYKELHYELMLMTIASCIGLISGVCSQLTTSRGWYMKPYFLIGINFFSTLVFILFFKISSLINVYYYIITASSMVYILIFSYGIIKIRGESEKLI